MASVENAAGLAPDPILQIASGFMASKVLFSAIELGIFTLLARTPLHGQTLAERAGLHPRSARDFLDALVSLKLLERTDGYYANSRLAAEFLDANTASYIGGILSMGDARLYGFWHGLTEALRSGEPQNEIKAGESSFDAVYSDPDRLEAVVRSMTGLNIAPVRALAELFPWKDYRTVLDVGCAEGALLAQVALRNEHIRGYGYDLPTVQPIFQRYVHVHRVADRVHFRPGDFLVDDVLPHADVVVMGNILPERCLETRRALLAKAHAALPDGGALIIYETVVDEDRRNSTAALLMSLNMLIETPGGGAFSGKECLKWMEDAGFRETAVQAIPGGKAMLVGRK